VRLLTADEERIPGGLLVQSGDELRRGDPGCCELNLLGYFALTQSAE